ncbi:MAG: CHC2 zinc finger domain-containing protein [bacterium]|nr:CHC2 zinc finger domain-containing protein [bacterium]
MGEKNWVDFKAVKAAVTMQMVLDHYGVNWLRKSGDELRGKCPIHGGEGERSFHVNAGKGAFHCFSCQAKGNVLDLVAAMEKCSVRDAAVKLAEWFTLAQEGAGPPATKMAAAAAKNGAEGAAAVINPPLGFQLRVDGEHAYGVKRGLAKETLAHFGAGLCMSKGTFAGRFVVPLHNELGELVGYAGRAVDDREPKYLFPSSEKGFHKKYLLFNLHRVVKEMEAEHSVVIVEGFFDCMKVHQAGFPCVALLGSSLSAEQEEMLGAHFNRAVLFFDGDEAGRGATEDCLNRLSRKLFVRAVDLPDGKQPDMLDERELRELLEV